MLNKLDRIIDALYQPFCKPFFGFVKGHSDLSPEQVHYLAELVGSSSNELVAQFEARFSSIVGEGECVAYGGARMGFYDLMKTLQIGVGDEVILLGATCAVMVNAVLRAGAKPVFADIDPTTLGSSRQTIEATITGSTRMIVAQHSFGIPCHIAPIVELARARGLFLLEDCALTLGSRINNVAVGNFGDAALFSTDHSKPLNTLIGGLIYTRDTKLASQLRVSQLTHQELSPARQQALFKRMLLEARLCIPSRNGRMGVVDLMAGLQRKLFDTEGVFLDDALPSSTMPDYPYPARLPAWLAALGLLEVDKWEANKKMRNELLPRLLDVLSKSRSADYLPAAYFDKSLSIVPLRVAWSEPNADLRLASLKRLLNANWIWFKKPIISTNAPLDMFGYSTGDCPVSERLGPNMINIPCNVSSEYADMLVSSMDRVFS